MELTWLDPEQPDPGDLAGAVAVLEAARPVDAPHRLQGTTVSEFLARLRHGWDGEPSEAAVTRNPAGRVVGVLTVYLPGWDNTHLASLQVVVDPVERRQGWGRQLFEAGVARARAAGRRLVCAACVDQSAGTPFLKAMGLDPVLTEVFRRQHLLGLDWPRLERELAAAQQAATGYELLRLPGPVPDELLPAVASMTEAINDAPTDDLDFEDEVFSPERIRAYEEAQRAYGRRLYRLVARERATGELAGHTVVGVETEHPWLAWQHDTSVVRAHRGHRLGLLLKVGMLGWLREVEPQLRVIDTGNAASNAHMIRVNEILGYEVVARTVEWQRHLS
ncbi:MAG: GNAT family N-acetyltransferase [Micromonosporaceae bacterium]|nr:GNAT family N-acetyltransferase [Micromonosporaceae bacterium]